MQKNLHMCDFCSNFAAQNCVRVKKALYIFAVILVSLLLVCGLFVGFLFTDYVENAAIDLAAKELAKTLGTDIRVGKVTYHFPARLSLQEVYIEDEQRDTLLYAGEVYAHFRPLALRDNEIRFSHVRLSDAVVKIYQVPKTDSLHTDSLVWNYQFIVDKFAQPQGPKEPMKSLVSVQDIKLHNVRLHYTDLEVRVADAVADLNHLTEMSIDAQVREMQAEVRKKDNDEKLEVESFKGHVIFNDTLLSMPTMAARLPNSKLDVSGLEVHFPPGDTLYLSKSAKDIDFSMQFREAKLTPHDIALFVPQVKHMDRPIALRGTLGGTLDSLYFNNLALSYDGQQLMEGDVTAVGLPDIKNPYIRANFVDVHTNASQLQDFLSEVEGKPVFLPREVHRLGDIHYRGLAEGRLHDLKLHGAFRTGIGVITTDGSFRSDTTFQHMDYDARVTGRKLRLGRVINQPDLSSVTFDIRSNGHIADGTVSGDVNAHVAEITYRNYTFEDFHMNGHYEPKHYNGTCSLDDPHLSAAFDGVVDLHDVNPVINANLRCRHFDSAPLGIASIGNTLQTRFNLAVDLDGIEPDRMSGYMVLDSLYIETARDSVLMRQMTLLVSAGADHSKALTLRSDYLTGEMDGVFRYGDIAPAMQSMMHHYLPTAINEPQKVWHPVTFNIRADGKRLRDVQRLFTAPVVLSDHPTLRASADIRKNEEPSVNLRFFAPGIRAGNTPVHDLTVALNTLDTLRHTGGTGGSGLALSVSAEAMKMQTVFSTLAFHDTLMTHLTLRSQTDVDAALPEGWRDLTPRELQRALSSDLTMLERQRALLAAQRAGNYGGDIKAITHFGRYNNRPLVDVHIMPGTLLLRDSIYSLGESRLTYSAADTSLLVEHFAFEGGGQYLRADGLASRRTEDTLSVDLQKIDASYVVPFLLPVQTIMFNGLLTGKAQIASVFKHPTIETQIHVDSMGLNNCYFGEADVDLHIKDSLAFHADVMRPTRKVVNLDGKALFDGSGVWELNMDADSVPLEFINHWTSSVLTDLDGTASGKVIVGGRKGLTYVLLRAAAQNASLTLPWTGARYTIPHDTILMDTTAILFPNVHLVDAEGNKVTVEGGVYHDQFADFMLDLHVDAKEALVFDQNKRGEMLQGKVYATGHVDVIGNENDILVNATALTTRHSTFRLSLDNAAAAYESNFIHFVQHLDSIIHDSIPDETDLDNIDIKETARKDTSLFRRAGRCLLTLNIEVNPQLLFQLVIGERNGDMIQARGSGALRLSYDTETGAVRLLGAYDIDQGTLTYTVANVIRKEFTVGEGSTIVFSGDATNPELDVTAKYRVTANLRDLFGDEADQLATSRSNIPVLTCLHMTGLLNNPTLSFSLEFPLSDQAIQQQVRQIINTDEMLMRQVIYLLVFGRFFTPDYMSLAQYATLNSTYSLLSSTVTGQINSWLSKLTTMLTLGVAIRTEGEGAGASQEYEAQIQLQPADRLVINGNVGYRYNDISNQPFFGDLDVEVLLTQDGQLRLKGYTHTVDKYSLRQASTIQGFGFLWKKDFNWPEIKRKAKESVPEPEQPVQPTDSTQTSVQPADSTTTKKSAD